jgi:Tfp pilus assembly protein PilV
VSRASQSAPPAPATGSRGSTLIEALVGGTLLAITLLGVCSMFVTGYSHVSASGRTTLGITGARQILEDVRSLPYDNLINLDGFDIDDATTLPSADPERELARRWRYTLAGPGVGWSFSTEEEQRWSMLTSEGIVFGGTATIDVEAQSPTLTLVTVRVSVPGRWSRIEWSTLITKL